MRAGNLDRRIDIQHATKSYSPSGQPIETWTDIVSNIPASIAPLRGEERFDPPQTVATDQVEFRIRYSTAVSGLTPLDRVVYPARGNTSPPTGSAVYDILQVSELGRREGLRIIAARRPDV